MSPPEEPEGCDKTRPLSREEKFIAERLSKFRFPTKDNSETKNKGIGKDACRDLAINVIMIDSMADLKVYMMNYDLEQVFIKGNIYGNCDSRAAALEEVYERLLVVLRKAEADWNAGQSTRGYFRSTAPTGPDVFVMDALARSLRPTNPAEESSSTFGSSSAISTPTTGYSRASTVVGRSGCDKLGNMARDELREEIQKVLGELAT